MRVFCLLAAAPVVETELHTFCNVTRGIGLKDESRCGPPKRAKGSLESKQLVVPGLEGAGYPGGEMG